MPEPQLTQEEVLEEVAHRDRREYPAITITELSERFDDVSRKTVQRRVNALADDGRLRSRQRGKARVFWLPESVVDGACPECGGLLQQDPEYGPGVQCSSCGAVFGALASTGGEETSFGRTYERGAKMVYWWASLPSFLRRLVTFYATNIARNDENLPDRDAVESDYRPENIRVGDRPDE